MRRKISTCWPLVETLPLFPIQSRREEGKSGRYHGPFLSLWHEKKFPIMHLRKTNQPASLGRPSHPWDNVSPLVGISSTHILNGLVLFSDRQVSCQELTTWRKYAILQLPLPSAVFKGTKNKYCWSPKWHKGCKKYNSSSPPPSKVSASTSKQMNFISFSARGRNHSWLLGLRRLHQNSRRNNLRHNVS